jgi:hypothetical protein
MPEAVVSGGANIGPANMHVDPVSAENERRRNYLHQSDPINVSSTKLYRTIFSSRDPAMLVDDELRPVE